MIDSEKLFLKADKEWDKGNLKIAFELFLEGAEEGHEGCQNNLGVFYDCGLGVKKNSKKALYWYKKALQNNSSCAMENIADYYYKQGNPARAKIWYKKAIQSGDKNAGLGIAKIYLNSKKNKHNINCAKKYLRMALKCTPYETISLDDFNESEELLAKITRKET